MANIKKPLDKDPWKPVTVELADTTALQALAEGKANEGQQKRALDWIIRAAAGAYDLSFRPGLDGDRVTAFAEGRRFVGLSIIKELHINASRVRRSGNED